MYQCPTMPGVLGIRTTDPHRKRALQTSPALLHGQHDEGQLQVRRDIGPLSACTILIFCPGMSVCYVVNGFCLFRYLHVGNRKNCL